MKVNSKKLALIVFILLLLFILGELIMRRQVFQQSLAELMYKLNKYPTAEKLLTKNAKEGDPTATANLAKSQYQQKKYADAAENSDAALQKAKKKGELSYDRGNIAYQAGDYETALKHYKDAILSLPEDQDAKANYELALKKKQEQPQPKPKDEKQEQQQKEEEIRNILGGLDNKESSDRQQQPKNQNSPTDKWW